ncbi:MAG: hypothetical protein J6T04_00180 [Bacteroidales bacterium]|nr:hypothetical protein [Bacteroidales bacterium]
MIKVIINKQLYESPHLKIYAVAQEGLICASEVLGSDSIEDWEDGGTTEDDLYL